MCGIVGAVGDIDGKIDKVFKDLLQMDVLRGPHSTGVVAVANNDDVSYVKSVGVPQDLFDRKSFDTLMRPMKKVLIGHNRWATMGKVNSTNAHPFQHGLITGVHNGTLKNQSLLPDYKDFEVDSDNIYHAISEVGIFDTVERLHGAYALVYFDEADKTINFVRNDERPLYVCNVKERNVLLFASEAWMLFGACMRNGLDAINIREIPVDLLHYIPVDEKGKAMDLTLHTEAVDPYVPPVKVKTIWERLQPLIGKTHLFFIDEIVGNVATLSYANDMELKATLYVDPADKMYLANAMNRRLKVEATANASQWSAPLSKSVLLLGGDSYYVIEEDTERANGFEGEKLTKFEFEQIGHDGCAWCSDVQTWEDRDDVVFISAKEVVCKGCQNTDEVKEFLGELVA